MKNIKLFDYQEDMKERIEKALRLHRSVMAQMPTGTGKTVLLASVVESFLREHSNCHVWIVAHRRELVSQIRETIQRVFSKTPSLLYKDFSNLPVNSSKITPSLFTLKEGSTSHPDPLTLRGEGGNRPTRCSEPLRSKVGGPSKVSPDCAGWDRLDATCLRPADGLAATCLRSAEGLGDRLGMSGASKVSPDCLSASAFNVPIKAVSIQWLAKHYDEIEEEPGMIVIDEAHHITKNQYATHFIDDFALCKDDRLVISTHADDGIKKFSIITITFEDGKYVHEGTTFFEEQGAQKALTLAQGLEWEGEDGIDDYC